MKIVRFVHNGSESYGVLTNDEIIDLPKLSRLKRQPIPSSVEGLVSLGAAAEPMLTELMSELPDTQKKKVTLELKAVTTKAPIAAPPKIVCLGLNYRDHAEEAKATAPDEPIIFMKPRTAIIGPEEPIV